MTTWTIELPGPPAPMLTMNQRLHWTVQRARARAWRHAAHIHTLNAIRDPNNPITAPLPPCWITVTLPVADRRRRDPSNYMLTTKHIVDGLVDAGLWPDDTPEYVTQTEPTLEVGRHGVLITLTERTERPAA